MMERTLEIAKLITEELKAKARAQVDALMGTKCFCRIDDMFFAVANTNKAGENHVHLAYNDKSDALSVEARALPVNESFEIGKGTFTFLMRLDSKASAPAATNGGFVKAGGFVKRTSPAVVLPVAAKVNVGKIPLSRLVELCRVSGKNVIAEALKLERDGMSIDETL